MCTKALKKSLGDLYNGKEKVVKARKVQILWGFYTVESCYKLSQGISQRYLSNTDRFTLLPL